MICCSTGASDISVSDIDRSSDSWSVEFVFVLLLNGDSVLNVEEFVNSEEVDDGDDVVLLKWDDELLVVWLLFINRKEDMLLWVDCLTKPCFLVARVSRSKLDRTVLGRLSERRPHSLCLEFMRTEFM